MSTKYVYIGQAVTDPDFPGYVGIVTSLGTGPDNKVTVWFQSSDGDFPAVYHTVDVALESLTEVI